MAAAGASTRRQVCHPRDYTTPKSFQPASGREAIRPTLTVQTERLDGRTLMQNLCQILEGLKHRAFALNALAPIASAEPEALVLQNIVESLESFDGQFQALEKAVGLGAKFSCSVKQCRRGFTRQDSLNRHIRKTKRPDHLRLRKSLDQRNCSQCHKDFVTPLGLRRHEKASHKGLHTSRSEMFNNSIDLVEQPAEESSEKSSEEVVIQKPSGETYAGTHEGNDHPCLMTSDSDISPAVDLQFYPEPDLSNYFVTMNPPFGNTQRLPAESSLYAALQTSSLSTSDSDYHFNTVIPTADSTQIAPAETLLRGSDNENPLLTSDVDYHFNTMISTSANTHTSGRIYANPFLTEDLQYYFNTLNADFVATRSGIQRSGGE